MAPLAFWIHGPFVDTYQGRDAFALTTQKRKRDVWCPIMPALAAEMETWERRPGPYLLQQNGKPFTPKEFGRQFAEARDAIPRTERPDAARSARPQ